MPRLHMRRIHPGGFCNYCIEIHGIEWDETCQDVSNPGNQNPEGLCCTRRAGHTGNHVGCYTESYTPSDHGRYSWIQTAPGENPCVCHRSWRNGYRGSWLPGRCNEREYYSAHECTRSRGHEGEHVACGNSQCRVAVWANDPCPDCGFNRATDRYGRPITSLNPQPPHTCQLCEYCSRVIHIEQEHHCGFICARCNGNYNGMLEWHICPTCEGCGEITPTGARHNCGVTMATVYEYHHMPPVFKVKGMEGAEPRDWVFSTEGSHGTGRFPSMPNNDLYFGLEVETESMGTPTGTRITPRRVAGIWKEYDMGWTMRDGSLSSGFGCENVTYPHTYERLLSSNLSVALNEMRSQGVRAWDTENCGLHIHMSKAAFRNKLHMFWFCTIHEKMPDILRSLAGRGNAPHVSWASSIAEHSAYLSQGGVAKTSSVLMRRTPISGGGHGTYINISNANTIECRFWRGSLNPVQVIGAVSMEKAIFEWAKVVNYQMLKDGKVTVVRFLSWVEKNCPVEFSHIEKLFEANARRGMARAKENA